MKRVCIIGLRDCEFYGEKLVVRAHSAGNQVYAYDDNIQYIIEKQTDQSKAKYLYSFNCVPLCNLYVITVNPDRLRDTVAMLVREVGDPMGRTVVVESAIPVGKTRSLGRPLTNAGFNLCYSPRYHLGSTSKLLSGTTDEAVDALQKVYARMFKKTHVARSIEVAESTRLLVGMYRAANVALINEFSVFCKSQKIDPFEAIDMASVTEANRYKPFTPWVGVGGDAGEDPFRISMVSNTPVIKAVANHLISRPRTVVEALPDSIDKEGDILVVGIGHRPYSSTWEGSPVADFIGNLGSQRVFYWDPYTGKGFPGAKWIEIGDATERNWEAILVFSPYMLSAWEDHRCDKKIFYCQTTAFI